MGRLLLVRHGATSLNAGQGAGIEYVRGWDDPPLNDSGISQAIDVASRIAKRYSAKSILCSDLLRTRQTAERIGERTHSGIASSSGLRTWNLGDICGKPVNSVLEELLYYEAHPEESPRNGESYFNFRGRYTEELHDALHDARRAKHDTVLVTHGRNIAATPGIISGLGGIVPYQKCPGTGALMEVKPNGRFWKLVWLKKSQ